MNADVETMRDIEGYLKRVRSELKALPETQITDIDLELRSHLTEVAEADPGSSRQRVADALERLGDPAALASAYLVNDLAARAESTRSPMRLFRLVSIWATRSLAGTGALLVAIFGYGITVISLGCAALKPFIPDRIGLWVRQEADDVSYQLGRVATPPADAQELLGWTIVPIGLLVGMTALFATTRYLRGKFSRLRIAHREAQGRTAEDELV